VENPQHLGLIMVGHTTVGRAYSLLGHFSCTHLIPSSEDILKALVKWSKKQGKRPQKVGIDNHDCFQRVNFLLQHVVGTDAQYFPPPTPEETRSAVYAGNYELLHGNNNSI
jgi:hypothetical protein